MKKLTLSMGILAACVTLLAITGFSAESARIEKINFKEQGSQVNIEFKGSERLRYRVKEYDSPPHFLVQFFNTSSALPYEKVQVDKGNVTDISIKEIKVNGETSTFLSVHLKQPSDFDFDLNPGGDIFRLSVAGRESSGLGYASTSPSSPSNVKQEYRDGIVYPPSIAVPGDKKGTTQIPYSYEYEPNEFNEVEIPYKLKDQDSSPYIVGPVILQDADISQAIRLLSEAAGGANIVVQSALVAAGTGITVTLSHITLEDALDIITSSNNWTWRKFGDYYSIMDKDTASQGVNTVKAGTVYEDSASKLKVVIMQPQYSYACRLMGHLNAVIADVGCDKTKNLIILRGEDKDIDRARELLRALDTPTTSLTKGAGQVTRVIKLKYIQLNGEFTKELNSILVNPYFGGLTIGGGKSGDSNQEIINSITLDNETTSIIYVGDEQIYERFYSLIQQLDVPSRQTIVKVIPIRFATVNDLQKMEEIEKFLGTVRSAGKSVKMLFSESTNTVTYIGPEEDFERIEQMINSIDVEDRRYVTEVVKLKYISAVDLSASEVMKKISVFPGFGLGDEKEGTTKIEYDMQTNSVIISTQKQYLQNIKNLIVSMDKNIFEDYEFEVFRLKYIGTARATQIVGHLMSTEANTEEYPGTGQFFWAGKIASSGEVFSEDAFKQSNKWSISPNFADNSIYVLARAGEMEMIRSIIRDLDTRTDQMKLDVQFVQLSKKDNTNFRLGYVDREGKIAAGGNLNQNYFFHNEQGVGENSDFFGETYQNVENQKLNEFTGGFFAYNTATNFPAAFSSVLDVLVEKIGGRIVSNPSVMATEANPVVFDFADRVPYVVTSFGQIEIRTARNGFYMTIIPHFKDDYIVLNLNILVADIVGYTSDELPIESAREVNTEIKCQDGIPFIIGGIVRSQETDTKVTFPILSDLPLVGSLFKQKTKRNEEYEVVMVITPSIVKTKD